MTAVSADAASAAPISAMIDLRPKVAGPSNMGD